MNNKENKKDSIELNVETLDTNNIDSGAIDDLDTADPNTLGTGDQDTITNELDTNALDTASFAGVDAKDESLDSKTKNEDKVYPKLPGKKTNWPSTKFPSNKDKLISSFYNDKTILEDSDEENSDKDTDTDDDDDDDDHYVFNSDISLSDLSADDEYNKNIITEYLRKRKNKKKKEKTNIKTERINTKQNKNKKGKKKDNSGKKKENDDFDDREIKKLKEN